MKLRARLLPLFLLLPFAAGCSLILDPENCTSDDDCLEGGACKSGICIGGSEAAGGTDSMPTGGAGGTTDAISGGGTSDTGPVGGDSADMDPGVTEDAGPDADMATPPDAGDTGVPPDMRPVLNKPPTCVFLAPDAAAEGSILGTETVSVTVQVTDPDTAAADLAVTLGGVALTLDGMNTGTVEQALQEGTNTLLLEARDPEGHTCMARRRVVRDLTGPTLAITTMDGAEIGNDFQVGETPLVLRVETEDDNGVAEVTAEARGIEADSIVDEGNGVFTVTLILANGPNDVSVTAIDLQGNQNIQEFGVFFDGVDPQLDVSFPIDGQIVEENNIDVRGTVNDNLGIPGVRLLAQVTSPGQDPVNLPIRPAAADGTFTFANVPLYNGDNTITVTARDAVRQAQQAINVRVESGAPVVDITDPNPAIRLNVSDPEVRIQGTASRSVVNVEIGLPGNFQDVIPEDGEWEALVRLPAQGTFAITAIGVTIGERRSLPATLTVLFDDTPPNIRITSPLPGFCTSAMTIQVEGDAVDLETRVPAVSVISTGNPNGLDTVVNAANHFRAQNVLVNEGLDQTLTVSGANTADLSAETSLEFSVDRTGPIITLDREDGAFIAADADGNIEVRGTVIDAGCGLAPIPLLVSGSATLASPEGVFVSRQNRGANPHLTLVATDAVANVTRLEVDYHVDSNPPTIEEVDPPGDVALRGNNITVSARVTDAESGLDSVTIGDLEIQGNNGVFSRNVALVPGDNAVEIVAVDNVGLTRTVTLHINRDVDAPTVVITSPAANAQVEDKLTIEGTVDDGETGSGVDVVLVNNLEVEPDEDGHWRAVGVPMLAGVQNVTVVATDQAGNQSAPTVLSVAVRDFGTTAGELNGLTGATLTSWLGHADIDGDGRLDILAMSDRPEGESRIFIQRADATFDSRPITDFGLPAGMLVNDAAWADLNNDARFDLIVAAPGGASTVYFGDRAAGFVATEDPAYPVPGDVTGIVIGDIDRNGLLDILFMAGANSALRFTTFGGGAEVHVLSDIGDPDLTGMTHGALIDLTTDGVQELVAIGPGGAEGWLGETDGTFTALTDLGVDFGSTPGSVVFPLDADRDFDLDIISIGAAHAVHANGLAGENIVDFVTAESGLSAVEGDSAAAGGDVDGDARDDVVVFGARGIALFGGAVPFTPRAGAAVGIPETGPMRTGRLLDLDGDGDLDIVAGGDEGVVLVRSNVTTTRGASYPVARLLATRALLDANAPVDSVGVVVFAESVGLNPVVNRALVHPVTSPLVVTFGGAVGAGGAARLNLNIQWIEKDNGGVNTTSIASQRPQAQNAPPVTRQAQE